jgi:hypothetical protein
MNERIRGLADKIWAEEYWDNSNTDKLLPAQLNRFAELIVRECYEECKGQLLDKKVAEDAGLAYNDGVMDCAIGLLQHFGVE